MRDAKFRLRRLVGVLHPTVATDVSDHLIKHEQGNLATNKILFSAYEGVAAVNASASSAHLRPVVQLENDLAVLEVDLAGGSLSSFMLKSEGDVEPTNPLSWRAQITPDGSPAPLGHFLCCDRWGAPSESEIANGMPFHGEASSQHWSRSGTHGGSSSLRVGMNVDLPMAGMSVERRIFMQANAAAVHITETVTNNNLLGRMYNAVQHPSIAPPFLDVETVVDSNATLGFPQSSFPSLDAHTSRWPRVLAGPTSDADSNLMGTTNMRRLAGGENDVCSFVIEEEFGWVTATSPTTNLLVGYLWRSKEYPWLSAWRNSDNCGAPAARGLEFGTTGVHQPFADLAAVPAVLDRPTYSYLDAGASHTRSYCMFLCPVEGARLRAGVNKAAYAPDRGELVLTGMHGEHVVLPVGQLPPSV